MKVAEKLWLILRLILLIILESLLALRHEFQIVSAQLLIAIVLAQFLLDPAQSLIFSLWCTFDWLVLSYYNVKVAGLIIVHHLLFTYE